MFSDIELIKKIMRYSGRYTIKSEDTLDELHLRSRDAINDILYHIREKFNIVISTQKYFEIETIGELFAMIGEPWPTEDVWKLIKSQMKDEWKAMMSKTGSLGNSTTVTESIQLSTRSEGIETI